ncbi:MAG TPA: M67 family metallopeptidase [Solirubrobacteraceae bacterium]|jgi:proteasome lid subunit RPN8/RPN11|nr:M67 family metallopeptidase [Solirubrobacteraceae bacterium]
MDISEDLLEQILAHAREIPTEECCGVVAVQEGSPARAVRVYRAENVHKSALKFEIDPKELLALWTEIQREGWELGAIYHSHVRSHPHPSQTDISFAASWPGVEWIIVGLTDPSEPEIRSYLIEEGAVREVEIGQITV